MPLKAIQIKAFSPIKRTYRKADEKGLYLEVRPNGSKLWFLKYRHLGAEKRIGLGMWPEISLAQASGKREEIRKVVQQGEDPLHERKMRQIAAKVNADNTFQSVAKDFIAVRLISANKAQPPSRRRAGSWRTWLQHWANGPLPISRQPNRSPCSSRSRNQANARPPVGSAPLPAGCSVERDGAGRQRRDSHATETRWLPPPCWVSPMARPVKRWAMSIAVIRCWLGLTVVKAPPPASTNGRMS